MRHIKKQHPTKAATATPVTTSAVSSTAAKEDMDITEDMEAEPLEAADLNAIKIGAMATKDNKSNSKGTRNGEEDDLGDTKTKKKRGEGEKRPCPARCKRYRCTHTTYF